MKIGELFAKDSLMKTLFQSHLAHLQKSAERSLEELGLPGLIFFAGPEVYKFEDDSALPFVVNHHFRHWCPAKGHGHCLIVRPGQKPLLLAYEPEDFWHAVEKIGAGKFWADSFEIQTFADADLIWSQIKKNCAGFALHGQLPFSPSAVGLIEMPARLLSHLNWERGIKTDFEIACLTEATRIARKGHFAAREAFLSGESEFGIYIEYLRAMQLTEDEVPYTPIIGLNAHAAILHYHWRDRLVRNGQVLLIDAGAQSNNYASDITRTHANSRTDTDFVAILQDMERAQLRLCDLVKPGLNNRELNNASRFEVAQILVQHKIVENISAEAMVAENLVYDFYPHGIGHPLGIHVHDVGGFQETRDGGELKRNPIDGSLRSFRTFEPRNYQTVEPGLYFIALLLKRRKATPLAKHYNWQLIEKLKPSGGIRIEDNVLVTETGHRNLTREILGDLPFRS
jgi:Xaa-Pro dipeptidase